MENQQKPGVKTTEFWLALAVAVAGAVASAYSETDAGRIAGIIASALSAMGYGVSRALTKRSS